MRGNVDVDVDVDVDVCVDVDVDVCVGVWVDVVVVSRCQVRSGSEGGAEGTDHVLDAAAEVERVDQRCFDRLLPQIFVRQDQHRKCAEELRLPHVAEPGEEREEVVHELREDFLGGLHLFLNGRRVSLRVGLGIDIHVPAVLPRVLRAGEPSTGS